MNSQNQREIMRTTRLNSYSYSSYFTDQSNVMIKKPIFLLSALCLALIAKLALTHRPPGFELNFDRCGTDIHDFNWFVTGLGMG